MKIKLLFFLFFLLLAAGWLYFHYSWFPLKQAKIAEGLAKPNFPWRDYTEEELNKLYPQIRNADIPTRATPEETYAKFREALRANNLEMALEQLAVESRNYKENKASIEKAYKEGRFGNIHKSYAAVIQQSVAGASLSEYSFLENKEDGNYVYSIIFLKNSDGDWKMDNL